MTRLGAEEGVLLRQVHPSFIREGRPSRQAFFPSKKEDLKLSVDRSTLTTAQAAFQLYTEGLGRQSSGTWGITVEECEGQELPAHADPLMSPPEKVADPAHALVDFSACTKGQRESKSVMLTRNAELRGRLHPPEAPRVPEEERDDIPF